MRWLNPTLALAALLALLAACLLGSTALPLADLAAALTAPFANTPESVILWHIRLPRAVAAFLTGAALGLSGAALQGLLRNPLAEPGVLGVSAMSALFASVAIVFGLAGFSAWTVPLMAILGALSATALIAVAALRTSSVTTLILIGVGLSSFSGALLSLLMNLAPNPFTLSDLISWTLGSVANRSWQDIALALPFLAAGTLLLFNAARGLSALTLGEEAAAGLGLDLRTQRLAVVMGAGLTVGAAVSIAGMIGFIGIVAPHLIRPLVRHDPARCLLPSALLGGLFLVLADIAVRLAPGTTELRLGVMAALIGAPVFIAIAAQRRGEA